jgi:hypothetical protein
MRSVSPAKKPLVETNFANFKNVPVSPPQEDDRSQQMFCSPKYHKENLTS